MFPLIPVATFLRVLKGAVVERILENDVDITEGKILVSPGGFEVEFKLQPVVYFPP